jgi:hypothetical protein
VGLGAGNRVGNGLGKGLGAGTGVGIGAGLVVGGNAGELASTVIGPGFENRHESVPDTTNCKVALWPTDEGAVNWKYSGPLDPAENVRFSGLTAVLEDASTLSVTSTSAAALSVTFANDSALAGRSNTPPISNDATAETTSQ